MIKIVFTDVDGTILDGIRGFPYVSQRNLYALRRLKEKGIYVIISSGRSHSIINQEIIDIKPDGYVLCNGSYVEVKEKVIYKDLMNKSTIGHIMKCTDACRGLTIFETQEGVYSTENNEKIISFFKKEWNMPMLEFKFGDPLKHEVYKMLPAFLNEEECKMFEKMIGNSYEIRRQKGMFAYDVTSKNIHKGEAVKKVLEYLDITKDEAIAFGDGANDIDMLIEAGTGVSVANGDPRLKEVADDICEDCLDDGFYKWLVKNDIIDEDIKI